MAKQVNVQRACVYDIVLDGEIIYIGMTGDPKVRFRDHKRTGVASEGAEMKIVKWYKTRHEAFKAEAARQKRFNICCRLGTNTWSSLYDPQKTKEAIAEFNKNHTVEEVQAYIDKVNAERAKYGFGLNTKE